MNILTDPIFSDLMYIYPRNAKPGISLENLPKIDFILISHNHKDHMEKSSILALRKYNPVILVPKGNRRWFDKKGFEKVFERDWWQEGSFPLGDSDLEKIKISFLPAIHWSGGGIFDVNRSLWGSWMIECAGLKIYFAGDSAYSKHFKQIGEKFTSIDLALMPIGPNEPRELIKYSHVNAQEAVQAFIDLNANHFIPMHWGTFRFGKDSFLAPIEKLKKHWKEKEEFLKKQNLHILKFGQQLAFDFDLQQAKQLYDYELL